MLSIQQTHYVIYDSIYVRDLKTHCCLIRLIEANAKVDQIDKFMSLKILEIFCNVPYKTAMSFKITDVNNVCIESN